MRTFASSATPTVYSMDLLLIFMMLVVSQMSIGENNLPTEIVQQLLSIGSEDFTDDSCIIVPKDVQCTRYSTKSGFHRDVHTSVSVLLDPVHHCSSCELLLIENLPSGLFVDLYQAAAAVEFGGPKILAFEEIDLEKPAYLSAGHIILLYPTNPPHILHLDGDVMVNFTIEMPIHLRYHRPSSDPDTHSARVSLPVPYLLFRCKGEPDKVMATTRVDNADSLALYKAPCSGTSKTICLWQLLPQNPEKSKQLHFGVPVGQQSHMLVVTMVTILATIVGTVALLTTMTRGSTKDKPD